MSFFLVGEDGFARLRTGRVAALTCHRHVIHSRSLRIHAVSYQNKKDILTDVFFVLVGEDGFEPSKALPADLQSVPFGHSGIPPNINLAR